MWGGAYLIHLRSLPWMTKRKKKQDQNPYSRLKLKTGSRRTGTSDHSKDRGLQGNLHSKSRERLYRSRGKALIVGSAESGYSTTEKPWELSTQNWSSPWGFCRRRKWPRWRQWCSSGAQRGSWRCTWTLVLNIEISWPKPKTMRPSSRKIFKVNRHLSKRRR